MVMITFIESCPAEF